MVRVHSETWESCGHLRLPAQAVHGVPDERELDQSSHQDARGVRKRMVVRDVRLFDGLHLKQLHVRERGQGDGAMRITAPLPASPSLGGPCTVPCAMKRAMPRRQVLPMSGGRERYHATKRWAMSWVEKPTVDDRAGNTQ
jgi:hypothetical protein